MYMKIYQPRPGEKRFLSLDEAGGTADPAKYEQVFCGDLDAGTPEEITQKEVSDDMWFKFYTF